MSANSPDLAQVEEIFGCAQKVERGTRTSDLVRGAAGLLCTGKSDFEAAEGLRSYPSVKIALYAEVLPGKEWMRQRLNALVPFIRDPADALTVRLLERSGAPITPRKGFGCVDIAAFVMDNSGSHKEAVSRTYQGVEGYSPIAAYLGCEGYCIGMELRPGSKHSALEAECFLARVLPRIDALYAPKSKALVRPDSAFDIARLLLAKTHEHERWSRVDGSGRSFVFVTKWNPRRRDKARWVARAQQEQAFVLCRPGKREAFLEIEVLRAWGPKRRTLRLIVRVLERTIDRWGQGLTVPEIALEGWWNSLRLPIAKIVDLYRDHGAHGQFHAEFKTDLDLERLPSGKFDTNDQRRTDLSGSLREQLPAPAWPKRAHRRDGSVSPPCQASQDQDRAAGDHVPCCTRGATCAQVGAGVQRQRTFACAGFHRSVRLPAQSRLALLFAVALRVRRAAPPAAGSPSRQRENCVPRRYAGKTPSGRSLSHIFLACTHHPQATTPKIRRCFVENALRRRRQTQIHPEM